MNGLAHLLPLRGATHRDHPALPNANDIQNAKLSETEKFCQRIAEGTGAPITLVAVIILQIIWIVFGQVTKMDPFPYVFMLTVSNVIQLVLIVVLAVAGKQQSSHSEIRAEEDHAALSRMLYHQQTQEALLLEIAQRAGIDVTEYQRAVNDLAQPAAPQGPPPATA